MHVHSLNKELPLTVTKATVQNANVFSITIPFLVPHSCINQSVF